MSILAVAFGIAACVTGLTLSFHTASPPGATISLVAVALLVASFAATLPRRGNRARHRPATRKRVMSAARLLAGCCQTQHPRTRSRRL
jgi:ABC 3 transport family